MSIKFTEVDVLYKIRCKNREKTLVIYLVDPNYKRIVIVENYEDFIFRYKFESRIHIYKYEIDSPNNPIHTSINEKYIEKARFGTTDNYKEINRLFNEAIKTHDNIKVGLSFRFDKYKLVKIMSVAYDIINKEIVVIFKHQEEFFIYSLKEFIKRTDQFVRLVQET